MVQNSGGRAEPFWPAVRCRHPAAACQSDEGFRQWKWHVDEVFVKINGERHYLWRAVDHEGEILESYVTRKRDKAAALAFLKKALKRHGKAETIVTDGLTSYLLQRVTWVIEIAVKWAGG